MTTKFNEVISNLDLELSRALSHLREKVKSEVQEIRLRINCPVVLYLGEGMYFISKDGTLTKVAGENLLIATADNIRNTFNKICNYSVYSYQKEIVNGFITIKGGHRVGICGTAIYNKNIENIKDITSLNFRIARSIPGISDTVLKNVNADFSGILIAGAPCSGKTTLLRDIARNLSIGKFSSAKKVVVIDERGEFSGVHRGEPQNDLGYCDILYGYSKKDGIEHSIRCLSPEIIVCDEIGNESDVKAIESGVNSGISFIASAHVSGREGITKKTALKGLFSKGVFDTVVFLNNLSKKFEILKVGEKIDKSNGNRDFFFIDVSSGVHNIA